MTSYGTGSNKLRRIDNTVQHDPESGLWGDCHRVCYAMMLGMEPEEVPHFYEGGTSGEPGYERQVEFLRGLGLVSGFILYDNPDLEAVLLSLGQMSPGVAFTLGGLSSRGCGHSVVIMDGEIHHDPTGSGIVGPMDDGYYWITFFSPLPGGAT